jgi:hypothetical protein
VDGASEGAELFRRGTAELDAASPDYEKAYRDFKAAYERSQDFRVLASLGHAAEALERDGEAIQAYAEYLAQGGESIAAEERASIERALRVLQANVGRVTITSPVSELTLIDSRVGSEAPPQVYRLVDGRAELDLRAGTHLLTATFGGDRMEWQVALPAGGSAEHRFEFARETRRLPSASAEEPVPSTSSASTLRVVALATGGLGTAALVAGTVTGLLVLAKEEDARALCRKGERGGTECPASARDEFDSARSLATVTNALFIGGAVLTAAGIGTFWLGSRESTRAARVRVLPEVSARETRFSVIGSF